MNERARRYVLGHRAENLAEIFLWCKFYRLRAKRYKTKFGEIDLIVTKNGQIIFCEVKARNHIADGLFAISSQAQQRIQRAAEIYCQQNPRFQNYAWRFDALVVRPWRLPYHLKDAWRP